MISEKRVEQITRADIIKALSITQNGFTDLLKNRNIATFPLDRKLQKIYSLSFNEGVNFILENPEVLKVPLILESNKLVIGYNSEEMRVFIPRGQRKYSMFKSANQIRHSIQVTTPTNSFV